MPPSPPTPPAAPCPACGARTDGVTTVCRACGRPLPALAPRGTLARGGRDPLYAVGTLGVAAALLGGFSLLYSAAPLLCVPYALAAAGALALLVRAILRLRAGKTQSVALERAVIALLALGS